MRKKRATATATVPRAMLWSAEEAQRHLRISQPSTPTASKPMGTGVATRSLEIEASEAIAIVAGIDEASCASSSMRACSTWPLVRFREEVRDIRDSDRQGSRRREASGVESSLRSSS